MKNIIIYGCGGFGREVLQILHSINSERPTWNCLGFIVDPGYTDLTLLHGLPVVNSLKKFEGEDQLHVVIAIGDPLAKKIIANRLSVFGYKFPILIHPRAWIGGNVSLDEGVVICANACLTTDIAVGAHVHINLSVTVGHDVELGSYSTCSPGANISGNVIVEDECYIGTGVTIIPGIKVGKGSVIGAGAAVVSDVQPQSTAVGVPAKTTTHRKTNL